jgi:hypothetical protein
MRKSLGIDSTASEIKELTLSIYSIRSEIQLIGKDYKFIFDKIHEMNDKFEKVLADNAIFIQKSHEILELQEKMKTLILKQENLELKVLYLENAENRRQSLKGFIASQWYKIFLTVILLGSGFTGIVELVEYIKDQHSYMADKQLTSEIRKIKRSEREHEREG